MIIKKILREAKKIVYDPLNYFPDLIVDIKKDVSSKNIKENITLSGAAVFRSLVLLSSKIFLINFHTLELIRLQFEVLIILI